MPEMPRHRARIIMARDATDIDHASPRKPAPLVLDQPTHRLDVHFTGSGSEYFRIWSVNLLLMLVTLTFYYPWAKVRRLQYFHRNTLVDGNPLDFHGSPLKMLRGYLLVGVLVLLYSAAGNVSALAGLAAFVIVAALWPALLKSSMQFRLANTSWRGLRFRFTGTVSGAYRALLPLFLPGLLITAALVGVDDQAHPPQWYGLWTGAVLLLTLAVAPWLWFNLKRYQHQNYALGQARTELRSHAAAFYMVFVKTGGVLLLLLVLFVGLAILASGASVSALNAGGIRDVLTTGLVLVLFTLSLYLFASNIIARAYFVSRMQNLVWSRTGNDGLRFRSRLSFRPYVMLQLKNWLLILFTLGLYWPFAAVANARMRLQALNVIMRIDPADLVDEARALQGDAAGDAAGDLLGMDIGL
jgi:uncharacterized membrane protein YjgN (DUF898 family)